MTDPVPTIAERIADHFEAIGKDNVRAAEIYADSIVLEYVNSGERIPARPTSSRLVRPIRGVRRSSRSAVPVARPSCRSSS